MKVPLIHEYNADGHLVHFGNLIGGCVRGRTLDAALAKIPSEVAAYCAWANLPFDGNIEYEIVQEKYGELQICDADSDVLFESEKGPLSRDDYDASKDLALKSAKDFLLLYSSVPDKNGTTLSRRKTFYGEIPATANEMYLHTKNVNEYYFGELNVKASNESDIFTCRAQGFTELEKLPDFLQNTVFVGSYGEQWSLKKLLRRFVWHDRIHAKALWRMATKLCGEIANPFAFQADRDTKY